MGFMEEMLPSADFARIHRSHIVNVNHIKEKDGNTVVIEQHRLMVSKRMKEQFMSVISQKGIIYKLHLQILLLLLVFCIRVMDIDYRVCYRVYRFWVSSS